MNLMHFVKISALVIFTSLLFTSCAKEELTPKEECVKTDTEQVWVELTNQTDETLVNFTLENEVIGDLAPGESFCQVKSSITLDSTMPVLDMKAAIDGEEITSYCFFCGTMMHEVAEGDFYIDIQLIKGYEDVQFLMARQAEQ